MVARQATSYDPLNTEEGSEENNSRSSQEWHPFVPLTGFHTLRKSSANWHKPAFPPSADGRNRARRLWRGPSAEG